MSFTEEERLASARAQFSLHRVFARDPFGKPVEVDHAALIQMINTVVEDELPEVMFHAAANGCLPLMHALQTIRGPITVEYEYKAGQRSPTLNGKAFKPARSNGFSHWTTATEAKAIFSTIKAYGMKGLVEPGITVPHIFNEANVKDLIINAPKAKFEGHLPFLDEGVLHNPELALCLSNASSDCEMSEPFMPMLCWASERMITEFPAHLKPMRPEQRVDYAELSPVNERTKNDLEKYWSIPASTFKSNAKPSDEAVVLKVSLGVKPDENLSEWAGILNITMGNEFSRLGLADPQGRVLCETRADFLLTFPPSFCQEANLLASKLFVDAYFPMDILALQTFKACEDVFGHPEIRRSGICRPLSFQLVNAFNPLFKMLGRQDALSASVMDMFTREQWLGIARNADINSITAEAAVVLKKRFSFTNKGVFLTMMPLDVDTFSAADYRFVDDTLVFEELEIMIAYSKSYPESSCVCLDLGPRSIGYAIEDEDEGRVLTEALRLHELVQSMNLWSSPGTKPESIKQALADIAYQAVDDAGAMQGLALRVYLVNQGIAACAKEATSSEEWVRLTQIFSEAEIAPYLKVMPSQAKGRVLENQLGL